MAKTHAGTARASKRTTAGTSGSRPRGTVVTSSAAAARKTARTAAPKRATKAARLPKAVSGAIEAARDKKAEDIVVLDLRNAGGFTDYFIICTGGNARQITAIADSVREKLKHDFGERPALAEGLDRSEWILLDYFNFVVHVFSRDCRAFYGLERLWGAADRYEFDDETRASASPPLSPPPPTR